MAHPSVWGAAELSLPSPVKHSQTTVRGCVLLLSPRAKCWRLRGRSGLEPGCNLWQPGTRMLVGVRITSKSMERRKGKEKCASKGSGFKTFYGVTCKNKWNAEWWGFVGLFHLFSEFEQTGQNKLKKKSSHISVIFLLQIKST